MARAAYQRRWLLWRAQKMAFWVLYDFAGAFVLLNICTLGAVFVPALALARLAPGTPWLPVAAAATLAILVLAGQAQLVVALLAEEEFSVRHVWRGVARNGAGFFALCMAGLAGGAVAGLGIWYYVVRLAPEHPIAGFALAGVCGGSGALLLLSAMFWLPALAHQRGSALRAAQIGFMLLARHPALALGLGAMAAAQAVLLATPPGVLLLSALPVVALSCCVYELLDRAYVLDEALERGEAAPARTLDENDIFLNRGFTDLLYPWKA